MGKDIEVIKGVEISYDPLEKIGKIVKKARDFGAELIVVHGETLVEPVERGTNKTAVSNPSVDLLAHPGLISMEEAEIASDNDVYLEITSRAGHCLANGHVVDISRKANAKLLLNSDAHSPEDLLTKELAAKIATGAGLDAGEVKVVMEENPRELMKKIGNRW